MFFKAVITHTAFLSNALRLKRAFSSGLYTPDLLFFVATIHMKKNQNNNFWTADWAQVFLHKMNTSTLLFSLIKIDFFFPDSHIVRKLISQSQCLCETVCLHNNVGSTTAFKLIICVSQYCLTNETQIELYKLSHQHPKINPETTLLRGHESFPVCPSLVGGGVHNPSSSFL